MIKHHCDLRKGKTGRPTSWLPCARYGTVVMCVVYLIQATFSLNQWYFIKEHGQNVSDDASLKMLDLYMSLNSLYTCFTKIAFDTLQRELYFIIFLN